METPIKIASVRHYLQYDFISIIEQCKFDREKSYILNWSKKFAQSIRLRRTNTYSAKFAPDDICGNAQGVGEIVKYMSFIFLFQVSLLADCLAKTTWPIFSIQPSNEAFSIGEVP